MRFHVAGAPLRGKSRFRPGTRRTKGRCLATAALGSALLSNAGGCVRYLAPVERDFERGDVVFHVESVAARRLGEAHVVLATRRVPAGVTLLRATVSDVPRACEDGAYATRLGRDRASTPEAPLVAGERMTLTFAEGSLATLAGAPAHLELLLRAHNGKVRCLALALADSGAPLAFEAQERWTLGLEGSIEAFARHIGPVSQVVLLPAALGVWIDDVHVNAGGGFAWAGCPETHCARPTEDQTINYATGFLGFAGAGMSLYERGEFALGASFRYRVFTLPADTRAGREEHWAHGPVLSPFVAAVAPPATPSDEMKGSREALIGLEVPVGYAFAENGERAVTVGGNLRTFLTIF